MKQHLSWTVVLLLYFGWCTTTLAQVKRLRSESPSSIAASNVIGSGNVAVAAGMVSSITGKAISVDPLIDGRIGIGGVMQLSASARLLNFNTIGPMEAHLQATLPSKKSLRFFGMAIRGDMFLSTAQDTISLTADSTRPEYAPFLSVAFFLDQDWISLYNSLPIKTYQALYFSDDPQQMYRYDQVSFRFAVEYKKFQHSYHATIGVSMFKEGKSKINEIADKGYEQSVIWIEPGIRYRLKNIYAITAHAKIAVNQNLKAENPLQYPMLSASCKVHIPLLFTQTNEEAVRTLMFLNQQEEKNVKKQGPVSDVRQAVTLEQEVQQQMGEETFDYKKEQLELQRRRKETKEQMQQIEQLLRELEDEK